RLNACGPPTVVALPDEASDIGTGRERPVALAAQHDDADVVVERLELRPERLDDPGVDGVHRRVVEPDDLDHDGTVSEANISRSSVLRNLPTLVFGISWMNS